MTQQSQQQQSFRARVTFAAKIAATVSDRCYNQDKHRPTTGNYSKPASPSRIAREAITHEALFTIINGSNKKHKRKKKQKQINNA